MTATYLEKLNREQRQAVEHGIEQNGIVIGPLFAAMAARMEAKLGRVDVSAQLRGMWK